MSQQRGSKRARSDSMELENEPIAKRTRNLRPLTASESVTTESCDEWKKILEKTAENVTIDTLIVACRANRIDVAEVLLRDYEIDINTTDHMGNGLLHDRYIISNSGCVQFLLEHGINVDAKNHEDITPLMGACNQGLWQCVQLLLAKNANPAVSCKIGNATALIAACAKGQTKCVSILLEYNTEIIHQCTKDGSTPLFAACHEGQTECVRLILSKDTETIPIPGAGGHTPLIIACSLGNIDCVRLLLDHNADISQSDPRGATSLEKATLNGHADCVSLLLERGADPNQTDNNGLTPLHAACHAGRTECIRLLIDHGAVILQRSQRGVTPLLMACQQGHTDCVSLLLEKGACPNYKYHQNNVSPFYMACYKGHTDCARLLLDHGADINATEIRGFTSLMIACEKGNLDCVRLLLEHDADTSLGNLNGATPLFMACQEGYTECASLILLKSTVTINTPRNDGTTPLHIACQLGHVECVRLLLEHDADTNDVQCANFAMENKHWDIVSLLLTHGAPVEKQYALLRPQRLRTHEDICTVCLDPNKELVSFLPCGHSCCCRDCLVPMVQDGIKCPLCRTTVTDTLFLPS